MLTHATATATVKPPNDLGRTAPEQTSPRQDLVTAILGVCVMGGAMTDGWAHANLLKQIQQEGFFTPWHALLYSAFTAAAGWTFWLAYRRRDRAPRWWVDGWPTGYRIGALGVVIFLVAGLADMVWHTVFGVETSIDALLSPSHLLLCVGTVLLLTSPVRSWWAAGGGGLRAVAGVLGLSTATLSIAVFLLYVSMFDLAIPVLPYDGTKDSIGYGIAARGVASYVVTISLLVGALLLAHRRRTTPGLAPALVAVVAIFPLVTNEFPRPQTAAALGAVVGAAIADWILVRLDRTRGFDAPLRLPIAGAVFAALVAAGHLLALHLDSGIHWPVELWTGTVVVTAALAVLIGGLASRPAERLP